MAEGGINTSRRKSGGLLTAGWNNDVLEAILTGNAGD